MFSFVLTSPYLLFLICTFSKTSSLLSRRIAPCILNFVTKCGSVFNFTPRPFFLRKRTPVPTEYEAEWALAWTSWKREMSLSSTEKCPGLIWYSQTPIWRHCLFTPICSAISRVVINRNTNLMEFTFLCFKRTITTLATVSQTQPYSLR